VFGDSRIQGGKNDYAACDSDLGGRFTPRGLHVAAAAAEVRMVAKSFNDLNSASQPCSTICAGGTRTGKKARNTGGITGGTAADR